MEKPQRITRLIVLWDIEANLLRQKVKAEINLEQFMRQKGVEKDKKILQNIERETVDAEREINRTEIFLDIVNGMIEKEESKE